MWGIDGRGRAVWSRQGGVYGTKLDFMRRAGRVGRIRGKEVAGPAGSKPALRLKTCPTEEKRWGGRERDRVCAKGRGEEGAKVEILDGVVVWQVKERQIDEVF